MPRTYNILAKDLTIAKPWHGILIGSISLNPDRTERAAFLAAAMCVSREYARAGLTEPAFDADPAFWAEPVGKEPA